MICCWHKVVQLAVLVSCTQTAEKQARPHGVSGLRCLPCVSNIPPPLWGAWRETHQQCCPCRPRLAVPPFVTWTGSPGGRPGIGGEQHLSREAVTMRVPDWPLRTWPRRVRPAWIELLCTCAYTCMRRRVAAAWKHRPVETQRVEKKSLRFSVLVMHC